MPVTHTFVSAVAEGSDPTVVGPNEWNANHTLSLVASEVNAAYTNSTAASSGTPQSSPSLILAGQYWTGSTSATDEWTIQDVVGAGTNGTSTLTLSHTGSSGTAEVLVANPTASTLDINVASPLLAVGGRYYGAPGGSAAADSPDTWSFQNIIANGAQLSGTGAITNIAESVGNVVTLTLVGSAFLAGSVIELSGFGSGKGDWLNGYCVTLLTGTGTTCTFNDPTSHGTLASTATTGTPLMTRVDSISTLAIAHAGSPGAPTITINNTVAATSTLAQSSPGVTLGGQYWTGSVSAIDSWTIQNKVANGTNGLGTLTFAHIGGGNANVSFTGSNTLIFANFSIGINQIAISGINHLDFAVSASGYGAYLLGMNSTLPYCVLLGNQTNVTASSTTTGGCAYGVAMGNFIGTTGTLTFAPTSGSVKFYGCGINPIINQTGTASGDYCGLMVNVQETAFLGTNSNLLELALSCGITNISETSGNVVTLTVVNNQAVTGQVVRLEGLTTATWLNGQVVTLSSGTNSTTLVFTDGSSHGTQASHADTGRASLTQLVVTKTGSVVMSPASAAPTSAGTAGTAGQILYYGGNLYFCSVTGGAGSATWNKLNMTAV